MRAPLHSFLAAWPPGKLPATFAKRLRFISYCLSLGLIGSLQAQTARTPLTAALEVRPLTPAEIQEYSLGSVAPTPSSGLATVGVGQRIYLDALINNAAAAANLTTVRWTLTARPTGSTAILTSSPLEANVPAYKAADRIAYLIADRAALRPDLTGQYTVQASITWVDPFTGPNSTNIVRSFTAALYMGAQTCAICHNGNTSAQNVYSSWTNTLHSHAFKDAINGTSTGHFSQSCIGCHTVGYDTNMMAVNGGFDDIAAQTGWAFPATISSNNWAAMPSSLRAVANIQCENCHGPGSEHVYALGKTNAPNWPRIDVSFAAGDCSACHDSPTRHYRAAEWNNSGHAVTTRIPSGPTRSACVRCHTAPGFVQYVGGAASSVTNTAYEAITCQTCHDPHDARNPHQLRAGSSYTLGDGTVFNAGSGGICFQCHHARNGSAQANIENYSKGLYTWDGGSSFGVHDSPQGDMLAGANAITYGLAIPSAAHRAAIKDSCVGCHMQPVASTNPAFTKAGGHTFRMSYSAVDGGVTNTLPKVDVCTECHGRLASFDLPAADYDGDGITEGVQTEVRHLLDKLSALLPNTNGVVDGTIKASLTVRTNWSVQHLKAAYNWQFVKNDGSYGVHNAPYAVGLLKASIADLTGDANSDGLPDSWQTQYFTSLSDPASTPDGTPAGDNLPNWFKFSLDLNPLAPAMPVPDSGGVLYANAGTVGGGNNGSLQIYRAAEIVFETEPGKTYQLQGISPVGRIGWSNLGSPVQGTGAPQQFTVPTRSGAPQYYRIVVLP